MAADVLGRHPGCQIRIIEADPVECFNLLLAEEADVAVVVATPELPPTADPRFGQHHLLEDPLDLVVPENHHLAHESAVALRDLVDELWIMDRPGRPYHQLLHTACAAAGFTPMPAHWASEWDTGAALVSARLGIALIPRLAHLPGGYPVVRVRLSGDPTPSRHLLTGIRRGSGKHPLVATALASLRQVADRCLTLEAAHRTTRADDQARPPTRSGGLP